MVFEQTQLASEAALHGTENDDCAASIRTRHSIYAWVIDGATTVAEENYLRADVGDVAWYSRALSEAIKRHADKELSAKSLHALAVTEVAALYGAAVARAARTIPRYAQPLAAITVIRIVGEGDRQRGDLFYLADCPAFTLDLSSRVRRLTLSDTAQAEAQLRDRVMEAQRAHGFQPKRIMGLQTPYIREQREQQLRTMPLGVSTPSADARFGGTERDLDLAEVQAVVLMSDGYERYATQYRLGDDEAMVRASVHDGAKAVLKRIRELEAADADCQAIPRLKPSDDATCIVLARTAGS